MARPRKLPDGLYRREGVYYCDFYANCQRVRKRLSTDFDAAKEILNALRARADRADYDILDNDCPVSELRSAYERYLEQTRPRSFKRYTHSLNVILAALSASKVSHISSSTVITYRQERLAKGVCARTVNHDVTILGAMLNWGVAHRQIGHNPIKGLAKLRHDRPKDGRPFTQDEIRKLLKTSQQPWRDIWYALATTGMRSQELAALTFDDIDWENRELIVRADRSKNHEGRRIPIDDGLYAILERQEANRQARQPGRGRTPTITRLVRERFTNDHVFVTTQNTPLTHRSGLWYALKRCCKLAAIEMRRLDGQGNEIDHLDVHSFRRTFATDAISNGADPKSVQEILGHKTLDMTMRVYTKIRGQTKRQAVARLSYGQGAVAPAHRVEYPENGGYPVHSGHRMVTEQISAQAGATQVAAG